MQSSKSSSPKGNKPKTEQQFTILPHPAKTNDPRDLESSQSDRLADKPAVAAHHAHGPQVLTQDMLSSLGKPPSKEELAKRAEELNK